MLIGDSKKQQPFEGRCFSVVEFWRRKIYWRGQHLHLIPVSWLTGFSNFYAFPELSTFQIITNNRILANGGLFKECIWHEIHKTVVCFSIYLLSILTIWIRGMQFLGFRSDWVNLTLNRRLIKEHLKIIVLFYPAQVGFKTTMEIRTRSGCFIQMLCILCFVSVLHGAVDLLDIGTQTYVRTRPYPWLMTVVICTLNSIPILGVKDIGWSNFYLILLPNHFL